MKKVFGFKSHVDNLINGTTSENAILTVLNWSKLAAAQSWTDEEIKEVKTQALSGNYENLLEVLSDNSED